MVASRVSLPLLLLVIWSGLSAVEIPPELKPILAKMDAQLAEAEKALHQAQAKAREDTVKELEKLLKVERKRKGSTLAIELESRIQILTNEANHLRDEPLLRAEALDEKIRTKNLSEDDWEAIPVPPLEVSAKEARTSTKVKLAPGDLYLVVPHPTDTWQASPSYPKVTFLGGQDRYMRLLVMVGDKELATWMVAEPGALTLGPKDDRTGDNLGVIRVKIIRVH